MTDSTLIDLMSDIDVTLLEDDYMEKDLKRIEQSWISAIVRRATVRWTKQTATAAPDSEKMEQIATTALDSEEIEQIATAAPDSKEMGQIATAAPDSEEMEQIDSAARFQDSVDKVKKKASAAVGFLYGVLTMTLVAVSFFALFWKKQVWERGSWEE